MKKRSILRLTLSVVLTSLLMLQLIPAQSFAQVAEGVSATEEVTQEGSIQSDPQQSLPEASGNDPYASQTEGGVDGATESTLQGDIAAEQVRNQPLPEDDANTTAESSVASSYGFFTIAIVAEGKLVDAPIKVTYEPGATILSSLQATPYGFEMVDKTSVLINNHAGVSDVFAYASNSEQTTVLDELQSNPEPLANCLVVFKQGQETFSVSHPMNLLVDALLRFEEAGFSGEQAQAAYDDAIKRFDKALLSDELAYELLDALELAMNILSKDQVEAASPILLPASAEGDDEEVSGEVRFDIQLGSEPIELSEVIISVIDSSEESVEVTDGSFAATDKGEYTYEILYPVESKKARGKIIGSLEKQTVTVNFPVGIWLEGLAISDNATLLSRNFYLYDTRVSSLTGSIMLPEGTPAVYLTATRGTNAPFGAQCKAVYHRASTGVLYESSDIYKTVITDTGVSIGGSGTNSVVSATTQAPYVNIEIRAMALGGTPNINPTEGDVYFVQTLTYDISRSRSLKQLSLSANGSLLPISPAFESGVYSYDAYVVEETQQIHISAETLTATTDASVVITLGDEVVGSGGEADIPLLEDITSVVVTAKHTDGGFSDYIVRIHKVPEITTAIKIPGGAGIEVMDESGQIVHDTNYSVNGQKDRYSFKLTTGARYQYTVTKGDNFTKGSFIAGEDTNPDVDLLYEDAIKELILKNGTTASAITYPLNKEQDGSVRYSAIVLDSVSSVNAFVVPTHGNESAVSAQYTQLNNGNTTTVNLPYNATYEAHYAALSNSLKTGINSNNLELTVTYVDTSTGETRGQKVYVTLQQVPTIKSLVCTGDGGDIIMEPTFKLMQDAYTVVAPQGTTQLSLKLCQSVATTVQEYAITVDGDSGSPSTDATATNPYRDYLVDISEMSDGEKMVLSIDAGDAIEYIEITLKRSQEKKYYFEVNPEDASLEIVNNAGVVLPDPDGGYTLKTNAQHTYTLVKKGYVSIHDTFIPTMEQSVISLTMVPVPENDAIDPDIPASWSFFRGEDNNAVTDMLTPTAEDNSRLNWAFKVNTTGMPIFVNGYVVTSGTSPNNLYYLDSVSGEVVAVGRMVSDIGFGVITPTYADGMIYMALSGGTIQAFNATPRPQTEDEKQRKVYGSPDVLVLDSVWVYQDVNGGSPNSPATYSDGCLYVGFFNGTNSAFVCVSVADEDPTQTHETKYALWRQMNGFPYYWAGAFASEQHVIVGGDVVTSTGKKTATLVSMDPQTGEVRDTLEDTVTGNIRSSICYDKDTNRYYFTSQGGEFWSVGVHEDGTFYNAKSLDIGTTSTSTPVVYNRRAYIGISGTGPFISYQGSGILVVDLESFSVAYVTATRGYPQSSGLLSTAYLDVPHLNPDTGEMETGYVYVYFSENTSPGSISYIVDKPGMTQSAIAEQAYGYTIARVLFAPQGPHAQYSLPSLVVDEYGTLYYKTDANYLLAVGAEVKEMIITKNPDKMLYKEGDLFDPTGMKVTITYMNGISRDITDYVTFESKPLSKSQSSISIIFPYALYGKNSNPADVEANNPEFSLLPRQNTYLQVAVLDAEETQRVKATEESIADIGEVRLDNQADDRIDEARTLFDGLSVMEQVGVANSAELVAAEAEYRLQQSIDKGEVSIGTALTRPGSVFTTLNRGGVSVNADLSGLPRMIPITLDEYYKVQEGKTITLTVDIKKHEGLSIEEKNLFTATLVQYSLAATDTLIDVCVFKQLEDGAKQRVSELSGSQELILSLEIAPSDQQSGRHYYALALHEGKAHLLPNKTPEDSTCITFGASLFSPFALVYSKSNVTEEEGGTSNTPTPNSGSHVTGNSLPGATTTLTGTAATGTVLVGAAIENAESMQSLIVTGDDTSSGSGSSSRNTPLTGTTTIADDETPLASATAGQNLQIVLIILGIVAAATLGFIIGRFARKKTSNGDPHLS